MQQITTPAWDEDALPTLMKYMQIPCLSPAFDANWIGSGQLERAAELLAQWSRAALGAIDGPEVEIVRLPGRTPVLFIEVPGELNASVVLYGHLDKQPAMEGWIDGRSAWMPTLEGDRLYGRGGADDGYALFCAVQAIKAVRSAGKELPRCVILIEASEESGSCDLPAYIDHLAQRLGTPDLVVALDACCGSYDRLWTTTSVRGQVAGALSVRVMREAAHSGDASGVVPSSLRILRQLLARIEDSDTGRILLDSLHVPVPDERRHEAVVAASILGGGVFEKFPRVPGLRPPDDDPVELLLNCAWRPCWGPGPMRTHPMNFCTCLQPGD